MEKHTEEAVIKVEETVIKVEDAFESEEISLSHIKFEYEPEFGTSLIIKEENELMLDESIRNETYSTESVDPLEVPEGNTIIQNCREVHRSRRVLSCTRCSEKFTDKKILMRHLLAHVNEEPLDVSTFSSLFKQKPKGPRKIGKTDMVIEVEGELIKDVNDSISESSLHSAADLLKTHKTCQRNDGLSNKKQRDQEIVEVQENNVYFNEFSNDVSACSISCKASPVNSNDLLKQSKTYYNADCIKLKDVFVLLENIGPVISGEDLKVQNKSRVKDKLSLSFDLSCSSERQNLLKKDLNIYSNELTDGLNGKEEWFPCTVCPSKFKLKSSFQIHLAKHCREGQYPFSEYLAKSGLNIDPQIPVSSDSHPGITSRTDISKEKSDFHKPEKSKPPGNIKNFLQIRSSRRVLTCAQCSEKFTDKTVLMRHLIAHSGDHSSCDDIPSKSKPKNSVENLLSSNDNENALLLCEYASHSPQIKPFTCPICHKEYTKKSFLVNHLAVHPNEKVLPCLYCSFSCITKDAFLSHISEKHNTVFSCSYCSEKFKKIAQLRAHKVVHTDAKPFTCTECSARFKRKGDLNVHLKKHFSEAKFKCTQCPFQFHRRNDFNKHLRSHSTKKMYACPHCPNRYKEKCHLEYHMLVHGAKKKFSCSICSRKFHLKHLLKQHLRTHSDSKLFACSLCSMKFRFSNSLTSHLRTHSTQRFSCAQCTSSYRYKQDLARHLKKFHSTNKQSTCSVKVTTFNGVSKSKQHLQKLHADNLNSPLEVL